MKLIDINEAFGSNYVATPEELNDEIKSAQFALDSCKRRNDASGVSKFEIRIKSAQAKLAELKSGVKESAEPLSDDEIKIISGMITTDYQKRGGNYPKSGVPDSIEEFGPRLVFTFKNTSESDCKRWVENFLSQKGVKFSGLKTNQDGDYEDDWVVCSVVV